MKQNTEQLENRIEELEKSLAYTEKLLREAKKKRPTVFDIFKRKRAA